MRKDEIVIFVPENINYFDAKLKRWWPNTKQTVAWFWRLTN